MPSSATSVLLLMRSRRRPAYTRCRVRARFGESSRPHFPRGFGGRGGRRMSANARASADEN
eukprot:4941033-Prymnesium_polylepis.1